MRIVFMGTPDFAVPCLDALINFGHEVVGVFTQPDKPVGRKQVLTAPPIKLLAEKHGIPVYQPERLKDSDALDIISELKPDINVVVAYGKILPADILNSAKYGSVNVHASLLPKYRGAAPIQWAVLNGDSETGVCVMQMDEGLDTGDILFVKKTEIGENETSEELFERLSDIGAKSLIETLSLIESGGAVAKKQPQGDFGYARMITKADSPIDFNRTAAEVHNQVRGLQTWPVAETVLDGKKLKIHKTVKCRLKGRNAGEIVESDKKLVVTCGDGNCLEILELQLEGKKKMDVKSFLSGNKIEIGTVLG
ncbi:MAG: methionyl-tRNA formyltransferase [Ruminococcaceae bacterium]|nr:methionyl-tRNA formyltransferase [Oscillospiraceae bacterium]